jgi:uncharacterized protein involved in exopolysaccharide biosynthesis
MTNPEQQPTSLEIASRLTRLESSLFGRAGAGEDFDIRELFAILWVSKWTVLVTILFAIAVSVAIAFWLPDKYTASGVLVPASKSSTPSLSKLASQFSGLSALAGISIGSDSSDDKTAEAIELIKSWDFQESLIRENHLEVPVIAAKGWSRAKNELLIDPRIYDLASKKWTRKFDSAAGQTAEPSGWELYRVLSKLITINQDKKTGFVTVSVESYSPYFAKQLTDLLIDGVNKRMQERDRSETKRNVEYLENKLSQTNLSEMKSALSKLIEDQMRTLMLADVSDAYVLKRLVSINVPEKKSSPSRRLIIVGGAMLGSFMSCIGLLLASLIRHDH